MQQIFTAWDLLARYFTQRELEERGVPAHLRRETLVYQTPFALQQDPGLLQLFVVFETANRMARMLNLEKQAILATRVGVRQSIGFSARQVNLNL